MFADYFELKLGGTDLKGRRLSIKELKQNWAELMEGKLSIERALEVIRGHVTLKDGDAFDPEELSQHQVRELIAELVLPKEGRGIADFIGLLSFES